MRRMVKCKMPGYSLMCPGGAEQFCAEYRAVYNAMTNPPDVDIAEQQDLMVRALVAGGVWTLLDVFYLFAQQSNAAGEALINWINPGTFDATLVNAPAFASLEGFTGDDFTNYINMNWNPFNNAVNFAQEDAYMFAYNRANITNTDILFGGRDAASAYYIYANQSFDIGGTKYFVGRVNINNSTSAVNPVSQGMVSIWRNSGTQKCYMNNSEVVSEAVAATGLTASNIYVLADNNNGLPTSWAAYQVSCFGAGSSLDATKRAALQNAFETYMDSQGTGIIP